MTPTSSPADTRRVPWPRFLGIVVVTTGVATLVGRLFVDWSRPVFARELDWLPLAILVGLLLSARGGRRRGAGEPGRHDTES